MFSRWPVCGVNREMRTLERRLKRYLRLFALFSAFSFLMPSCLFSRSSPPYCGKCFAVYLVKTIELFQSLFRRKFQHLIFHRILRIQRYKS